MKSLSYFLSHLKINKQERRRSAGVLFLNIVCAGCLIFSSQVAFTQKVDEELMRSLKLEANHDLVRLKSLKGEKSNQKIFENEREKGLGTFLEDQEKWDLARERGLTEYRKRKKQESPQEGGPEYKADQKEKQQQAAVMEKSRELQVRTRDQVFSQNKELIQKLENEELGLNQNRPRYDLRKRGQNRWVKNSSQAPKAGSTPSYSAPPPPVFDDFPPPPSVDYQPVPSGMDSFEEIPPPPPPVYEGYGNGMPSYDSGFGDIPAPPPPPPIDLDF